MQNVEIKIDLSALARARETREAEGILYDLSDPFDRALFEAVLEDQLNDIKIIENILEAA